MSEQIWIEYPPPPGYEHKRIPKWARRVCVCDGEVFAPAEYLGGRAELRAMYDGVPMIADSGHVYLPLSWMANEGPPEHRETTLKQRDKILADAATA